MPLAFVEAPVQLMLTRMASVMTLMNALAPMTLVVSVMVQEKFTSADVQTSQKVTAIATATSWTFVGIAAARVTSVAPTQAHATTTPGPVATTAAVNSLRVRVARMLLHATTTAPRRLTTTHVTFLMRIVRNVWKVLPPMWTRTEMVSSIATKFLVVPLKEQRTTTRKRQMTMARVSSTVAPSRRLATTTPQPLWTTGLAKQSRAQVAPTLEVATTMQTPPSTTAAVNLRLARGVRTPLLATLIRMRPLTMAVV